MTYQNCYEILNDVRIGINEWNPGMVQGTDTTGVFPNSYIINQINKSQQYLWNILFPSFPEYFLTSASLTIASSAGTLPSDCHKIKRIEDSDGNKISPISVNEKHISDETGSQFTYYRYGNTIRLDEDSLSGTYTLWYYKRCIDLTTGMSSAGGTKSLTLATSAKAIADYYNNATIENITGDWTDTISDYSAARVCTLSAQTGAASQYYGTVSNLPELFHSLISEKTILELKRQPMSSLKVTSSDIELFNQNLNETIKSFAGTMTSDMTVDNIFANFDPIL